MSSPPRPPGTHQRRLYSLSSALAPAGTARGSAGEGRLLGKVAIVTGGANGIGRATVLVLAEQGCNVAVADRDAATGERVAEKIRRDGGTAIFVETDVTDEDSVAHMVAATVKQFGKLDILVNSAGVNVLARLLDTSVERWDMTQNINLRSVFLTCRAAVPHMAAAGAGSIISVSSIQGTRGFPNFPAYVSRPLLLSRHFMGKCGGCMVVPGRDESWHAGAHSAVSRRLRWPGHVRGESGDLFDPWCG